MKMERVKDVKAGKKYYFRSDIYPDGTLKPDSIPITLAYDLTDSLSTYVGTHKYLGKLRYYGDGRCCYNDCTGSFDLFTEVTVVPFTDFRKQWTEGWLLKCGEKRFIPYAITIDGSKLLFTHDFVANGQWLLENCELSKDRGKTWGVCGHDATR